MSSRALGEETEKCRRSLEAIDLDGDYVATIKGKRCEENSEMLQRSAIAFSPPSQPSEVILNHILSEGVNCLTIKPMGGMLLLITFETFEDKKSLMESGWLLRWFSKLINVNDESASLWRETWLNIYGVPLIAWGYDNFFNIGCVFGRVISTEYRGFECARILVFTDCLFEINCKMSMEIDGKCYPVFVSENTQLPPWDYNGKSEPPSPWHPFPDSPSPSHAESEREQANSHQKTELEKCVLEKTTDSPVEKPPINILSRNLGQNMENDDVTFHVPRHNHGETNHQPTQSSDLQIIVHSPSPLPDKINTPPSIKSKSLAVEAVSPSEKSSPLPNQTTFKKILNFHDPLTEPAMMSPLTKSCQVDYLPYNPPLSPTIPTFNHFGPLIKPKKPTISTSTSSGPTFPPGFESSIPTPIKIAHSKKKKEMNQATNESCPKSLPPSSSPLKQKIQITAADILLFADELGLVYHGPRMELEKRINTILSRQKAEWKTDNQ